MIFKLERYNAQGVEDATVKAMDEHEALAQAYGGVASDYYESINTTQLTEFYTTECDGVFKYFKARICNAIRCSVLGGA